MKAFFVVAVVAAVVAAAQAASIQEEHPIDWYDCSRKDDGNYLHPSDCTRFISCSGGVASQRDCASCNVDPRRCPDGRLVYDATEDACLWADQTECVTDGSGNSTSPNPEPTTTTTERSESTTEEPTTTDDGSASTTEGPSDPEEPREGGPCNPEDCENVGYCQSYFRCNKTSSTWVKEPCGLNLVWNPRFPNGTKQIHGGNCDIWDNLDPEVEHTYRTDPKCLACFWEATGECKQEYLYQAPNGTHRNVLRLSCADGLVFSLEKETCQRCEDVKPKNSTQPNCCPRP